MLRFFTHLKSKCNKNSCVVLYDPPQHLGAAHYNHHHHATHLGLPDCSGRVISSPRNKMVAAARAVKAAAAARKWDNFLGVIYFLILLCSVFICVLHKWLRWLSEMGRWRSPRWRGWWQSPRREVSLESALRGCAIWGAHRSWLWLPRIAFRDGQIFFESFKSCVWASEDIYSGYGTEFSHNNLWSSVPYATTGQVGVTTVVDLYVQRSAKVFVRGCEKFGGCL